MIILECESLLSIINIPTEVFQKIIRKFLRKGFF